MSEVKHTPSDPSACACLWCRTTPNGSNLSCTTLDAAMKCAWLTSADKAALVRREREFKEQSVRNAAPDMLTALKVLVACEGGAWHAERYQRERREALDAARAAIALAEGHP